MGRIRMVTHSRYLSTHSWTSFPFSNLLVINEINTNLESIPYRRTANFSRFNGQQIRIFFDYKVTVKVVINVLLEIIKNLTL